MLQRIALLVLLFLGSVCVADTINYGTLDPSYYKYIKFYQKTTDKEIAELVQNLDEASKKTGLFLGLSVGALGNDVASNLKKDYLFAYGAKFGYQSFIPSIFEKLFLPNYVGRRIYIQYLATESKEEPLGRLDFSTIAVNGDLMIDLPVWKGLSAGIIAGIGLGSMIHGYNANSEFAAMLNTGFGVTFFGHNRLELELKFITDKNIEWLGALFMAGYQYVF
ncbi:hypothetical protein BKH41_03110 [Helicobacter sp. 12S02232-10]|uniref:outer membrane beta-barrel protein n=1 Tax=Helicobacter sp. 12S02232-10 TaxID=1476197 RepID=UPI000BA7DB1B|nr:outer membrane beta-barrel protein [Helicobacter sp. 12S02232-10]PAF49093.1 hypothetical protein BKH41_03110 [Helicobacter sp. 12S02232-10]